MPASEILLRLAIFLAGWAFLHLCSVALTRAAHRRMRRPSGPLAAPVELDVYELAYLARGKEGVRDTVLARLVAHKAQCPETASAPALPSDPHVLETAVLAALRDEQGGKKTAWALLEATPPKSVRLETRSADPVGPIEARLREQALLISPKARALLVLPGIAWGLTLTGCLVMMLAGSADVPSDQKPPLLFIIPSLCLTFSLLFFAFAFDIGPPNRHGAQVLADARKAWAHLAPWAWAHWRDLTPEEFAQSVAVFGLHAWAAWDPWNKLFAALRPQAQDHPTG
jgi:uncharacterized protein (TIGR04222 family)